MNDSFVLGGESKKYFDNFMDNQIFFAFLTPKKFLSGNSSRK